MEYVYHCKKTGADYVYATEVVFAKPQDAYAWRRGVREYADNYHASVTTKGENAWKGTAEAFAEKIGAMCTEALTRFNAGDVPGERAPTDAKVIEARKMGAALVSLGLDAASIAAADPVKLAKWLESQARQGRAA